MMHNHQAGYYYVNVPTTGHQAATPNTATAPAAGSNFSVLPASGGQPTFISPTQYMLQGNGNVIQQHDACHSNGLITLYPTTPQQQQLHTNHHQQHAVFTTSQCNGNVIYVAAPPSPVQYQQFQGHHSFPILQAVPSLPSFGCGNPPQQQTSSASSPDSTHLVSPVVTPLTPSLPGISSSNLTGFSPVASPLKAQNSSSSSISRSSGSLNNTRRSDTQRSKADRTVGVLDLNMDTVYHVPQAVVSTTRGGTKCLDYNAKPQWMRNIDKEKPQLFFLCDDFVASKGTACAKGSECEHVHACVWQEGVRSNRVHKNATAALRTEPTVRAYIDEQMKKSGGAGATVSAVVGPRALDDRMVILNRTSNVACEYALDEVLYTRAVVDWLSGATVDKRVYMCSHFAESGVCTHGSECGYMHAVKMA